MSEDTAVKGLLPTNSSALERALDLAFGTFIERVIPPFPELMNPAQTPVDFLSYLAADRGVLGWSTEASTESKRATVLSSWGTKRLAGTRKALRQALETIGFAPRFVPWYEADAEPYTLLIVATSGQNQTPTDYQNLGSRIQEAQSERDQIVIKVEKKIPLEQRLYIAQYMRQVARQAVLPASVAVDPSDSQLCIGTMVRSARVWELGTMTPVESPPAQQFFGCALRTATFIRIEAMNG